MFNNNTNIETQKGIYFPELDGLRFLAFLLVFVHHHPLFSKIPVLSYLHTNGWIGVDLFFALSAFLFTKLLVAEYYKTGTISFKKFYLRRIFRIWPLYFFFIIIMIIWKILIIGKVTHYMMLRILGLVTFTDNIFSAIHTNNNFPFSGHLWTISFEEQFYLFVPLIILVLITKSFKIQLRFVIILLIAFYIFRIILITKNFPYHTLWLLPVTHFESIIFGMIIGFGKVNLFLKKINLLILELLALACFILLSLSLSIYQTSYLLNITYLIIGVITALLLYAVLNDNKLKKIFSKNWLVFLGKRSYGLYVYHLLGNELSNIMLKKLFPNTENLLISFLLSLSITILFSIISYKYLETPFLKWKKNFEVIISRPI